MKTQVQRIVRIARNVTDLGRAIDFYCDALGFRLDDATPRAAPAWMHAADAGDGRPRTARLLLGDQQVELTESRDAAPYPAASTSADLWFQHCAIVVAAMDVAFERVIRKGAPPITRGGPQTLPPSTGSVTAFKFRDPDGHPLELIQFPPGTGDAAWQREPADPERPALGIDHSAISVADVERSIAFYAGLGFSVSSKGVNRGVEQQRLDDLDDVEVDVVALRPARDRTPHLELLGYRTPRGRTPPATTSRGIAADRLELRCQNLHDGTRSFPDFEVKPAAQGTARSADDLHETLLRDPDGHWLALA